MANFSDTCWFVAYLLGNMEDGFSCDMADKVKLGLIRVYVMNLIFTLHYDNTPMQFFTAEKLVICR